MATLYELNGALLQLQRMIEDGAEGLDDTLESIELELAEKLEGYAMVITNIQSDVDGLDAEIKRLTARKKSMENNIERMKQAMSDALNTVEADAKGVKRLKTDKFTFSFRKSSTVAVDENKVSRFYIKTKTEVDKAAIKKVLSNGGKVPGAVLVENQSLQIK